jgi:Na+/proline symporter
LQDSALYIALILAAFTILFGTRHLDATERHEGMVAAIAFESVVKLVAFVAVGVFVTFGIYDGFGDIFARPQRCRAEGADDGGPTPAPATAAGGTLTFLSMLASCSCRASSRSRWSRTSNERTCARAIWLFPLYLLLINIFVLPIAVGGLMHFPDGSVDADTFVLTLPMAEQQEAWRCWCSSAACRRRPAW